MIHSLRSALSAIALLSVLSVPAVAADLACGDVQLVCSGFEPNWQFTLDGSSLSFVDPENPNWESAPLSVSACAVQLSTTETEVTAGDPLNLDATVTEETCTQPSGETWPFSVNASFNQGAEGTSPRPVSGTGCCRLPE